MTRLFISTPEYGLVGEVVDELLRDGLSPPQIHVFSIRPDSLPTLPVKTVRYRPPTANIAYGATIGAAVGLAIGLLMLAGFGGLPVLVLVTAFAIGGALSRRWFGHGLGGELHRLDAAIRQGSAVMVLEVDSERVASLQRSLSQRHPALAVLGADIEGSPPFP